MIKKGIIAAFLIVSGSLLLLSPASAAVSSCIGAISSLTVVPSSFSPSTGSLNVGVIFSWAGVSNQNTDCTTTPVNFQFRFFTTSGTVVSQFGTATRTVGANQSTTVSVPLTKDFVAGQGPGQYKIVVSAYSGTTVFATRETFFNITGTDTGGVVAPPSSSATPGSSSGTPSQPVGYNFELLPPTNYTTAQEFIAAIATWIFNIAIPLAVIMIIYAGVRFLLARGNSGEVTEARQILVYAVIGLAIVLIGRGFVSLIQSVLDLGSDNVIPTTQVQNPTPTGGGLNAVCISNNDCQAGYFCFQGSCFKQ